MNIHHLELFYYVARHGGIMEAVRHMPYGIQQPAISGQVAQLEEFLGVTLFRRRPFSLTAEGRKLFDFIEPFFSNLDNVANDLQGGQARQLRIGASSIILRNYMPALIHSVKERHPGISISLQDGYPAQLEDLLLRDEMDVAITVLSKQKKNADLETTNLMELQMVLLVHRAISIRSSGELWKKEKIEHPLICLPGHELLCRQFQEKLRQMGVDWFPTIEVSSLELVERYAASGLGIGLSIAVPDQSCSPEIRALALPDFPSLSLGILSRRKPSRPSQVLLEEVRAAAEAVITRQQ